MTPELEKLIDAGGNYSFPQLSRRLGVALSTVWRWHLKGKLPAGKIGGRRFATSDDLREFVRRCNQSDAGIEIRTPAAASRASRRAAEALEKAGW